MNKKLTFLAVIALSGALISKAGPVPQAPPAPKSAQEPGPFDAGRFNVSPFAALKVTEIGQKTGKWAGGIALSYSAADNVDVEVSALSYQLTDDPVVESFDEGAVNFKGYLPLGQSGFAPYGLIGYTRDHPADQNLMNAGAGLEFRLERARFFAEGQYQTTFQFQERENRFQFRIGGGLSF